MSDEWWIPRPLLSSITKDTAIFLVLLRLPLCMINRTVIFDLVRTLQFQTLKRCNLKISQRAILGWFSPRLGGIRVICLPLPRLASPLMRNAPECHLKEQMKRTDTWSIDPRMLKSTWEMHDWLNRQMNQITSTNASWRRAGTRGDGFVLRLEESRPPPSNRSRTAEPGWTFTHGQALLVDFRTEKEEFSF